MLMRNLERLRGCVIFVAATALILGGPAGAAEKKAKNIILFIADGSGFNTFLAGSYYEYGAQGQQPYEQAGWVAYAARTAMLVRGGKPSGEVNQDTELLYDATKAWEKDPEKAVKGSGPFKGYNYRKKNPTDSAAAATALATGIRTYNAGIGYANGPEEKGTRLSRLTIAELAKMSGRSAGVVTSVPWSHATPAALGGAHKLTRNDYAGIANEMLTAGVLDVIMGAGNPDYDRNGLPRIPEYEDDYKYVGGPETWEKLKQGTHPKKWTLIQTRHDFESLTSGPTPAKVVGTACAAATLQQERSPTRDWDGDGYINSRDLLVSPAYGDPLIPTVPTLATMTRAALNVLDNNPNGFYLMVEGGAPDWANHANQPGRMIEEIVDFNHAVAAAVEWVNANSSWDQTLILVTSDHETGMLWGPESDRIPFQPIVNNGAGNMPGMLHNSGDHTNSLVPLFARGPGSELLASLVVDNDPRHGDVVDNVAVFEVMKRQIPQALLARVNRAARQRIESPAGAPYLRPGTVSPTTKEKTAADTNKVKEDPGARD